MMNLKSEQIMKEIKTWDDYCKVHGDSMYFETNELRKTHGGFKWRYA